MPIVKLREGDTFEGALRRFKRMVDKARILQELRDREHYVKNSTLEQRRKAAAKKRLAKKLARERAIFREVVRASSNHYRHYNDKSYKDNKSNSEIS